MSATIQTAGNGTERVAFATCDECGWQGQRLSVERYENGRTVGIERRDHNQQHHAKRYSVTVSLPTEYVDNTLQTASWWDRYMIQPGTYEVTFEDYDGHVLPNACGAAWGRITVDAVLVETYRVNRLFTASSSETTTPNEVTTLTRSTHGFFVDPESSYNTEAEGRAATFFGWPVTVSPR